MSNDIASTVLAFSKYSSHCKKLLTFINSNPHSLYTDPLIKLSLLCIDNEDIRRKIKSNDKIQIDKVPTILVVKTDGVVLKFEGRKCVEFVVDIYNQLNPPPIQHPIQQVKKNAPPVQHFAEEDEEDEEDEEEVVQIKKPTKSTKKTKKTTNTPIEDLVIEDVDNDNDDRNDNNNNNMNKNGDIGSKVNESTKSTGIMALAADMQKNRGK
jgi:hypothetical protein